MNNISNSNRVICNYFYRDVELNCALGDILHCAVDAICVSCDSNYSLNAGVGSLIRGAGGHAFMRNLSRTPRNSGVVAVPSMGCGWLRTSYVILVPLKRYHRYCMNIVYSSIFECAKACNIQTLAVPALGTGLYGLSPYEGAAYMKTALKSIASFTPIQRILFIDLNETSLSVLRSALSNLIANNTASISSINDNNNDDMLSSSSPSTSSGMQQQVNMLPMTEPSRSTATAVTSNNDSSAALTRLNSMSQNMNQGSTTVLSDGDNFANHPGINELVHSLSFYSLLSTIISNRIADNGNNGITSKKASSSTATGESINNNELWTSVSAAELLTLYYSYLSDNDCKRSATENDDDTMPCAICLCELLTPEVATPTRPHLCRTFSAVANCKSEGVVRLNVCKHLFHEKCIKMAFDVKRQCPLCMNWSAPAEGNQPLSAKMQNRIVCGNVPGHNDANGFHEIRYAIPSGIQTDRHIRPGVPFYGTTRIAYLPNNDEGTLILRLLKLAFQRRLTFTVGDSITSGRENVVVWNGIHHKTSKYGGPESFGYPDPDYLNRVKEELAAIGIRKELLNND